MRVADIQAVGGRAEGQQFVQAVLANITCELRAALTDLHRTFPKGTFIDKWGVQTTLRLTYDENGAVAPSILWSPPSPATSIFSLGSGLTFSSDATRVNTINAYYLVSELERAKCSDEARPDGPFLLQGDLKLSEWLFDAVSASMTNTINFTNTSLAVPQNVIQHEVKFQIVTSATLSPARQRRRDSSGKSPSLRPKLTCLSRPHPPPRGRHPLSGSRQDLHPTLV
jgi:hypothetical protein